ncbi:MAG: hypothetical protein ACO3UU_02255 [Minisyncoccia bacterium]
MINIPAVKTKFDQSTNIEIGIGATLDINCNSLVSFDDDDFTGANYFQSADGRQPFKLLFPIDSVVKPFRPEKNGIKYAIFGDISPASAIQPYPNNLKTYNNPRSTEYKTGSGVTYRTYCPSKNMYYKYYLTQKDINADFTIRYFNAASPISANNRAVPANKIVLKFELAHSTPSSWSIFINGTDVTSGLTKTVNANTGVVEIYYNGTSWSTSESSLNYNAQVTINTLRVTATNPGGGKYLGIIEVAPHWVKDITDRMVRFDIQKEASSASDDILPVGLATANSLDMELNSYGNANILFKTFSSEETVAINNSYIYMVKKAEIKPYYKIYDASGESTDSKGKYYKVPQGSFYLDNWKIGEHGELDIFALDGAKFLQETICPDILCDDYSATAVIRRILDAIGFTTYEFKLKASDNSIPSFRWWWSDGTKTVWAVIQEICKDVQMSAVFDENNILQFYSREYVFDSSKSVNWTFRNVTSGTDLPNIVSLESQVMPASNNIKVIYNSAYVAAYEQSNKSLVEVDKTVFASAALLEDLPDTVTTGSYMKLGIISINPDEITTTQILQSFAGYVLINSEIIEYDAIEYEYDPISGGAKVQRNITGPSDYIKYRGEAKVLNNETSFRPTERYRIKTRAAFGTKLQSHTKSLSGVPSGWTVYQNGILSSSSLSGTNAGAGIQGQNDYTELWYVPPISSSEQGIR